MGPAKYTQLIPVAREVASLGICWRRVGAIYYDSLDLNFKFPPS